MLNPEDSDCEIYNFLLFLSFCFLHSLICSNKKIFANLKKHRVLLMRLCRVCWLSLYSIILCNVLIIVNQFHQMTLILYSIILCNVLYFSDWPLRNQIILDSKTVQANIYWNSYFNTRNFISCLNNLEIISDICLGPRFLCKNL